VKIIHVRNISAGEIAGGWLQMRGLLTALIHPSWRRCPGFPRAVLLHASLTRSRVCATRRGPTLLRAPWRLQWRG